MVPRGEVGLIFAGLRSSFIPRGRPVVPPTAFSALVLMVVLTTVVTPPLLKLASNESVPVRARPKRA
jgi:hypothetical protein